MISFLPNTPRSTTAPWKYAYHMFRITHARIRNPHRSLRVKYCEGSISHQSLLGRTCLPVATCSLGKYPRHALLYYSTLQTSPNYLSKPQSPGPGQVPPVNVLTMCHRVARSPLQRVLLEMYSACSQRTFSESSWPMSLVSACQSFLFLEHWANNE
jgi:hypothetical protein